MNESIIAAGFGGQGILFMTKLIAYCGMKQDLNVTWMPSYGAEVRGGTAHAMVRISDKPITSPLVKEPASLLVMNAPSLAKFSGIVESSGILIVNSSLVEISDSLKDITVLKVPATDIAVELGDVRAANMVMLGAYVSKREIIAFEGVVGALQNFLPKNKTEIIEINRKALQKGRECVTTKI